MPIGPLRALCGLLLLGATTAPAQQPPEPNGPHPRLFDKPGTHHRRKEVAGPRARAVANRHEITSAPDYFGRDGQMGTGSTIHPARVKRRASAAWIPAITQGTSRVEPLGAGKGTAPADPA